MLKVSAHPWPRACFGPLTVCVGLLLALAAGCEKGAESGKSPESEEAETWRTKYESLVRQNEEVYGQIKDLQKQNADLLVQATALKQDLAQAAASHDALREVEELKEQLAGQNETIKGLRQQVKDLQGELAAAPGSSRDQLADLQKKAAQVRRELWAIGRALLDGGNHEAARGVLAGAAELGGEDPALLGDLAYCHSSLGDEQAAAQWYARAVEAVESQRAEKAHLLPKLYSNYGATLLALEKPQDALTWYLKAVEADNNYAPAHFNLGRLYAEHLGDPARAIEHYRRHVALGGSRSVAARAAIQKLLEAEAGAGKEGQPTPP